MTEAFWWFLIAGFFIGFSISTLWEWLYFRRRRMAIRDRRIAELEAALRTYAAAASAPSVNAAVTDDWGEPQFESPHVYLETEEPTPTPDDEPETPPVGSAQSGHMPVFVAASTVTDSALDGELAAPVRMAETPPATPFRSVAVPSPAASTAPQPVEAPSSQRMQPVEAAAVVGAAAAVQHATRSIPAEDQLTSAAEIDSFNVRRGASVAYANGHAGQRHGEASQPTQVEDVAVDEQRPITSGDLDALAASINDLITTLNKSTAETTPTGAEERPPQLAASAQTDISKPMGRIERMLVRLVQAMAQFARQVRSIVSGQDAPAPALGALPPGVDDLTRINGLTAEHVARLRVAGVTTFDRLAALSPDELRLLTLTPGSGVVDVEEWRAQAANLAVASPERANL